MALLYPITCNHTISSACSKRRAIFVIVMLKKPIFRNKNLFRLLRKIKWIFIIQSMIFY